MIKIGLTGGIGSGKTTVAKMFETLGIPVFYADAEAKKLLDNSIEIRQKLTALFGADLYAEDTLDKQKLAQLIFNDKDAISEVNKIVHPAVAEAFAEWAEVKNSAYVVEEAAILFETGGYKKFDKNILVSASIDVRIDRIKKRDNATEEQILARMKNQLPEEQKIPLADFVILNDGNQMLLPQILQIHEDILRFANQAS